MLTILNSLIAQGRKIPSPISDAYTSDTIAFIARIKMAAFDLM